MNIALIGFGTVGQGFIEILHTKFNEFRDKHQFEPNIVAIATYSRGSLYHPNGLILDEALRAIEKGHLDHYADNKGLQRNLSVLEIIHQSNADVIVEASTSNLETGQPAIQYVEEAIKYRKHVIMANKGPIALAFQSLQDKATQAGVVLRFEGTVMAGTPSIQLALEALSGCTIYEAKGIINGTTNYMLTRMEQGLSYKEAFEEADQLGYLEADPTLDVGGWDAAGKVLILANILFGKQLTLDDLVVQGITELTQEDIHQATAAQKHWKLLAQVTPEGGSVLPICLSTDDPLAHVQGGTNAITYKTDLMGDVTIIGAGAGKQETGYALVADLLAIHRQTSSR